MTPNEALEVAIILSGSQKELAKRLGVTSSLITYWRQHRVPRKHVLRLVDLAEGMIRPEHLRPDLNWDWANSGSVPDDREVRHESA